MKRFFIIAIVAIVSVPAFAQVKFGLRFAPNISYNRLVSKVGEDTTVNKNSAGLRMSFGPSIEIGVSDHVSFATGFWFTSKRGGLDIASDSLNDKAVFKLHYMQIPVTIKYFTNDITDKMKLYFQLGGTIDLNVAQDVAESELSQGEQNTLYDKIAKPLDMTGYVGVGVEMQIGQTNVLFGGLNYNRGLSNILKKDFLDLEKDDLKLSTDLISLEVGIKF